MVVVQELTVAELDTAVGAVDAAHRFGQAQVDLVLLVELAGMQPQAVARGGASEDHLGRWRPLIGQVRFVADDHDLTLEHRARAARRQYGNPTGPRSRSWESDIEYCVGGTRTMRPSSSVPTAIWQLSREFVWRGRGGVIKHFPFIRARRAEAADVVLMGVDADTSRTPA